MLPEVVQGMGSDPRMQALAPTMTYDYDGDG